MRVTDFTFDFGFWRQCGNGVDHDNVNGTRTRQRVTNFQRLLTGVRLRTQQVVDIHTQLAGINRVQRVLGIDKRTGFTFALCRGDHLQRQGSFTGGLWPVDFYDTAHRQTASAQRDIQRKRTGGDGFHIHGTVFTQAHDGAFTELLFDLAQCCRQRFLFVFVDSHYYSCHAGRSDCASPWISVLLVQLYCMVIQYQVFCRNCCQSVFNA